MRHPDPAALRAAAEAIASRRLTCEDSALDALPDDPLGIVGYVHAHRGVPAEVLYGDAGDALVLLRELRVAVSDREYAMIRLARSLGYKWREIAAPLGLNTPQAAEQRFLRLQAWQAEVSRSDTLARELRAEAGREPAWLAGHEEAIWWCARQITAAPACARTDDLGDAIDQLADAVANPDSTTRELMALLSYAGRAHRAALPHLAAAACETLAEAGRLAREWPQPEG